MNQNTQKSTWRKNCKGNGLCGGGSRSAGNYCDTRDYKILSHDFCGKCQYGWRRPWLSPNDWCCSYHDFFRYGNHSSILKNIDKTTKAMNKEDKNQFLIPLPSWTAWFIRHLHLTPQGLLTKPGKSDRLIWDGSFIPTLKSTSILLSDLYQYSCYNYINSF